MRLKDSRTFSLSLVAGTALAFIAAACGGGSSSSGSGSNTTCTLATGASLGTCDPGFNSSSDAPGTVEVTFSGEYLGETNGLPFPPTNIQDPFFVDGWSISFDEILVVVGNFRLQPGTQSQEVWNWVAQPGAASPVATKAGPFVLDMHNIPQTFPGKEGNDYAQPLFMWTAQDNGKPFATNGPDAPYAFSYDVMQASYPATQVNLTAQGISDYALMVANGWSKLYRGKAVYVGYWPENQAANPAVTCSALASAATTTVIDDFLALDSNSPVYFVFGWNDATSVLNCCNSDFFSSSVSCESPNGSPTPAAWGIEPTLSGEVTAQVTLHVDHAFWDFLRRETPSNLRFDHIATRASQGTSPESPFDLRTLISGGLAVTFEDGTPLPDRGLCQAQFATANADPYGTSSDPEDQSPITQIVLNPNGVPAVNLPGVADFMAFSAQSQMHLNNNALCYIVGQHPGDLPITASNPGGWYLPDITAPSTTTP